MFHKIWAKKKKVRFLPSCFVSEEMFRSVHEDSRCNKAHSRWGSFEGKHWELGLRADTEIFTSLPLKKRQVVLFLER